MSKFKLDLELFIKDFLTYFAGSFYVVMVLYSSVPVIVQSKIG